MYVVDANRTPSGPPRPLRLTEMADALILMAAGFEKLLPGDERRHFAAAAEATSKAIDRRYRAFAV